MLVLRVATARNVLRKASVMLDKRKGPGAGDAEASHQDRRAARALNNEGTDASKSPRDLVTEQRKRLRDTGFAPIPVSGKRPVI